MKPFVLVTFLATMTKYPSRSRLRDEGFILAHGSVILSIIGGDMGVRQLVTFYSQPGNRKGMLMLSLLFPLSLVQDPSPWDGAAHICVKSSHLPLLTPPGKVLTNKPMVPLGLESVKLAVLTNPHIVL